MSDTLQYSNAQIKTRDYRTRTVVETESRPLLKFRFPFLNITIEAVSLEEAQKKVKTLKANKLKK